MLEARMARLWSGVLVVVALGAFGVAWMIARPPAPKGYSALEFAQLTGAAASRAPLLTTRGATRLDAAHRTSALFDATHVPTAAVCYNDAVALGLMLGLHQRGLRPGQDFALTGFDDIAEAALGMPSLTTLSTVPHERGRQAAQLVMQRLQQPQAASRQTIAPVQLVVRESSCPPSTA